MSSPAKRVSPLRGIGAFKELVKEYNASFGEVSERQRSAYVQVWP